LDVRNSFKEEIRDLPSDFSLSFMTGRPEFLRKIDRPLTAKETRAVAHALATLIETNGELQQHSADLEELVEQLRGGMKGINHKIEQLYDKAGFREPVEDADDI